MSGNRSKLWASIVALLIVVAAFAYRFASKPIVTAVQEVNEPPTLGALGSEHSHASILIMINGRPVPLSDDRYMERDDYVHMHDNNGFYIHKHAKGVTLDYFLNTLGIKLTNDCISFDARDSYCTNGSSKLSIYIDRQPYTKPISYYEIADGDKILIDYGTSTAFDIGIELNSIPDLDPDLLKDVEKPQ